MSFLDDLAGAGTFFKSAVSSAVDVAGAVADAKFGWQTKDLQIKLANSQLQSASSDLIIKNTIAGANVEIAKLQAQAAITNAQYGLFGAQGYNADNINTAIANLGRQVTGQTGGSSIMPLVLLAGVAVLGYKFLRK